MLAAEKRTSSDRRHGVMHFNHSTGRDERAHLVWVCIIAIKNLMRFDLHMHNGDDGRLDLCSGLVDWPATTEKDRTRCDRTKCLVSFFHQTLCDRNSECDIFVGAQVEAVIGHPELHSVPVYVFLVAFGFHLSPLEPDAFTSNIMHFIKKHFRVSFICMLLNCLKRAG